MSSQEQISQRAHHESKLKKIMLVDDDYQFIEILSKFVQRFNYGTVIANEGHRALELYRKEHPDLVLMDHRLTTINGCETSSRILKWDPKAKIVFITAYGSESCITELKKMGVREVIEKPINSEILKKLLKKYLEK